MEPYSRYAVRTLTRTLGLMILVCLRSPARGEEPPGTSPPLNRFLGRVWEPDRQTPASNALVAAVDVKDGVLIYAGPTDVMVHAPEEKVLWFFTKPNEGRSATVFTRADGRFSIEGLRAGEYHVLAVHPQRGMAIVRRVKQPTSGDGLEIVLEHPTFLEGSIRGLSSPATALQGSLRAPFDMDRALGVGEEGATNMIFDPRFSISEDGSFHVGPLPYGGEWSLDLQRSVPKRNFNVTVLRRSVTVTAGSTNKLEIDLTLGAQVSGQVVGPTGEPLADVAVQLRPSEHEYGVLTDTDGRFRIAGIPDGVYRLDVKRWLPRQRFG